MMHSRIGGRRAEEQNLCSIPSREEGDLRVSFESASRVVSRVAKNEVYAFPLNMCHASQRRGVKNFVNTKAFFTFYLIQNP